MTTWNVGNYQEMIGQPVVMTTLLNWAAQTTLALPILFSTAPWDDEVKAADVPAFLLELEGLWERVEAAPPDVQPMLELMISVTRRAVRERLPIIID